MLLLLSLSFMPECRLSESAAATGGSTHGESIIPQCALPTGFRVESTRDNHPPAANVPVNEPFRVAIFAKCPVVFQSYDPANPCEVTVRISTFVISNRNKESAHVLSEVVPSVSA
jgi:hypothetical protein